jgi:hypothetical protein
MKICMGCEIEKQLNEFSKLKKSKDGYNTRCKKCRNEVAKEWVKKNPEKRKLTLEKYDSKGYWEKNKEKLISANKEWKKNNKDKLDETTKEWRKNNPDKVKEIKKLHYQKHREKIDIKNKEYREKNPEKIKEYYKRTKEKESYKKWRRSYEKARQRYKTVEQKARKLVHYAVKNGTIQRPENCSRCQKECKPEGHHPDYSKPLDVVWLCKSCHVEEHKD